MKRLPIGIQTFSEIIKNDYLYVDKTQEVLKLISAGKYFFLSRPRRFGKSLLLSTIAEIFDGDKELFKGLTIYDKWPFKKHPVIRVDFSKIGYETNVFLKKNLTGLLNGINKDHKLDLQEKDLKDYFAEVIQALAKKTNSQVVLLIDEYDKPIIDHITDYPRADANRAVLRDFYGAIKGCDEYLKFVLLTGVSKFAKVSIFSGLNNLEDITLDEQFSGICGLSAQEMTNAFAEYIQIYLAKNKSSQETLFKKIKRWYNGYSWDGTHYLYNPFSLLNFFNKSKFSNYWFETGTPTFLINLIREQKIKVELMEETQITASTFDNFDIDNIDVESLMFQTGYLTVKEVIKSENGERYRLAYPNHEVKDSLLNQLVTLYTTLKAPKVAPLTQEMAEALHREDIPSFIKYVESLLASIPYTLIVESESYYHSLFYLITSLTGFKLDPEVLTNQGRIDGMLELKNKIVIIEIKYAKKQRSKVALRKHTKQALKQILARKYYEKYASSRKRVILLGLTFSRKKLEYLLLEDGREGGKE